MPLRNRLSAEDFEKLPEALREHYSKGTDSKGEGYFLQTEEAATLKSSLQRERSRADMLAKVVRRVSPDLSSQLTDDNRDEWEDLAEAEGEKLKAYRELGDPEEIRTAVESVKGDGKRPDKDELQQKILDLNTRIKTFERDVLTANRDRDKAVKKAERTAAENDLLVRQRDIALALDEANVTDPEDRKVVAAIWQAQGLKVNKVGEGEETKSETFVTVEGAELPIKEFAKDFAGTTLGKRFVKAPDHAGVGDGTEKPKPKPTKEQFDKLDPLQKLGTALDNSPAVVGAR